MNYLDYLDRTRGSGYTRLLIEGLEKHPEAILICHTFSYADTIRELAGHNKKSSVNLYYNYPDKLMGNDKPLAFDNAALTSLFRDCLTYIRELEKENIELKRKNLVKTYALGYVNNPIDYAIKTLEDVSNLIGQDKQVLFSILALREYQQDLDNANFQNR
jgi:hypothetical protein